MMDYRSKQNGGTLLGLIIGLIIGLGIAVAVAITIKNTPLPFVDKMAKTERTPVGKMSDPNKPLYGNRDAAKEASKQFVKKAEPAPEDASDQIAAIAQAAQDSGTKIPVKLDARPVQAKPPVAEKPDGGKTAAEKSEEKYTYFLQAGAFLEKNDADNTKAKLALLGFSANIEEKESNNGTLYRVRIGPFGEQQVMSRMRGKLSDNGVDAAVVRVPK